MRKITLLLLFLAVCTIGSAQHLYLEGGKSSTSFEYKNSEGEKLPNLQSTQQSFMGFGFKNKLFTENLNGAFGINYSSYGAIGSADEVGNFMEWNVNYVGLNIGLDYRLFSIKKANVYVKGGVLASFFTEGTQTINNRIINLKDSDNFDNTLVSMQIGAGFSHPISNSLSVYVQYLYGKSLDIEKGDEVLKIKSNNLFFGLLIDISKKTNTEKPTN